VQGQLRGEYVSVDVKTECAHCARPIEMTIDSDLGFTVREEGCEPVIFVPQVDLFKVEDENIIDAF
jgi:hypothetical protein